MLLECLVDNMLILLKMENKHLLDQYILYIIYLA